MKKKRSWWSFGEPIEFSIELTVESKPSVYFNNEALQNKNHSHVSSQWAPNVSFQKDFEVLTVEKCSVQISRMEQSIRITLQSLNYVESFDIGIDLIANSLQKYNLKPIGTDKLWDKARK